MQKDTEKLKADRDAIINAAETEFAGKGFYGARVDEIAALSGINKRFIYKIFGSKEELYKAVLYRAYKKMANAEAEIFARCNTCEETIKRVIKGYFEFLNNNPSYINLILWENLNKGEYVSNLDFSEIKNKVVDYILKILKEGIESGEFKEDIEAEQVLLSILTFTFSYFSNKYTLSNLLKNKIDFSKDFPKRIDNVTEMILTYIKR